MMDGKLAAIRISYWGRLLVTGLRRGKSHGRFKGLIARRSRFRIIVYKNHLIL